MTRETDATAALSFLEAAYAWELDDETWLRGLMEALVNVWDGPSLWACGFEYDVSKAGGFDLGPAQVSGAAASLQDRLVERLRENGPGFARHYRNLDFGYSSKLNGFSRADNRFLTRTSTVDFFGINGRDGGGHGCFVGVGVARSTLTAWESTLFHRLSSHLGSAYRCRSRLRALNALPLDDAEAVLDHDGRLLEARAEAAEPSACNALARAGDAIARLRRGAHDPEPTASWRPRVSTRWTLVDVYRRKGERYIVARENQAPAPGLDSLTERERQVVASAASGKSNKDIAYELGISPSTTRVLLSRAYARLRLRSRKELFQLPAIRALRGESTS
jgi:DNA-binding CsgD family transcriptional regulator